MNYSHLRILKKVTYKDSEMDKKLPFKVSLIHNYISPYCGKVRAYLDFNKISHDLAEVDLFTKEDYNWSPSKKVPIVLCTNKSTNETLLLADSTYIIDRLESFKRTGNASEIKADYTADYSVAKTTEDEKKWRKWADDFCANKLSMNLFGIREIAEDIFHSGQIKGEWNRHLGLETVNTHFKDRIDYLVGAVNPSKKSRHDLRAILYSGLEQWMSHLESKKMTFMGGKEPNLADLSLYGVFHNYLGTNLVRDIVMNTRIGIWFSKMEALSMSPNIMK